MTTTWVSPVVGYFQNVTPAIKEGPLLQLQIHEILEGQNGHIYGCQIENFWVANFDNHPESAIGLERHVI